MIIHSPPLTLTLSPEGRGNRSLILSPEGKRERQNRSSSLSPVAGEGTQNRSSSLSPLAGKRGGANVVEVSSGTVSLSTLWGERVGVRGV